MSVATWNWRAEYDADVRARLQRQPRLRVGPAKPQPFRRKACRKTVRDELRALPRWAQGAEPGVVLLKPAEITAAALKAKCRACPLFEKCWSVMG